MRAKVVGIVLAAMGLGGFALLVTLVGLEIALPGVYPVSLPIGDPGRVLAVPVLKVAAGAGNVLLLPIPFILSALMADVGVLLAAGKRLAGFREFVILLIVFSAFAVMCDVSKVFLRWENLSAILLAVSIQAIVAIGMTVLLVSGGFDLSVGSTVGLCGAVTALCLVHHLPVPAAILAGLALGTFIGVVNGLIVAKIGINAFITTLGMMGIVRGALLVITKGQSVSDLPDSFKAIGQGVLGGFQYPILISVALIGIGDLLLRKSRFFRQNYYIGGNEKAAVLSGIRVDRMKIFNFALTGLLAGAAGIIFTARLGSASVTAGNGLELQVISAVIIGGASLQGGEGTVLGSFLGCILMAIIVSSLTLLNVDVYWNTLIIGATLLIAVMIDTLSKKRKGIL